MSPFFPQCSDCEHFNRKLADLPKAIYRCSVHRFGIPRDILLNKLECPDKVQLDLEL